MGNRTVSWLKKLVRERPVLVFLLAVIIIAAGSGLIIHIYRHQDAKDILGVYRSFCAALEAKDFESAYSYMAPAYRSSHSLEDFTQSWRHFVPNWPYGCEPYVDMHLLQDKASIWLGSYSGGCAKIFSGGEYELQKVEGKWYLTGEYNWYVD